MDDAYFKRVEAVDYAMSHDDGKTLKGLSKADVILVGVSRTSKTPTSIFLARRGIKAANIPLVPGVEVPDEKLSLVKPMYVGLIASSDRLMQLRRSRLKAGEKGASIHIEENRYLDVEEIDKEIKKARRLYSKKGWPVIDVTKRSIEETAAEIMALLQRQRDNAKKKKKEQAQAVTGEGT